MKELLIDPKNVTESRWLLETDTLEKLSLTPERDYLDEEMTAFAVIRVVPRLYIVPGVIMTSGIFLI